MASEEPYSVFHDGRNLEAVGDCLAGHKPATRGAKSFLPKLYIYCWIKRMSAKHTLIDMQAFLSLKEDLSTVEFRVYRFL